MPANASVKALAPATSATPHGDARPPGSTVADAATADRLGEQVEALRCASGGSVFLLPSPRTPRSLLPRITARVTLSLCLDAQAQGPSPYAALLRAADAFVVTGDSVMMVSEALMQSKPTTIVRLSRRPDWRYRLVERIAELGQCWRPAARLMAMLHDLGLVQSVRELALFHEALQRLGVASRPQRAREQARREQAATLDSIRGLLVPRPAVVEVETPANAAVGLLANPLKQAA